MSSHNFEWRGGHPALDFVNTLDERLSASPIERLDSYAALTDFVGQAGLVDADIVAGLAVYEDRPEGRRVLAQALQLREILFAVAQALAAKKRPPQDALKRIETNLQAVARMRRLMPGDESRLRWSWRQPKAAARPLLEVALSTEDLLMSPIASRIKACAAEDCGVLFVDRSRAASRRWCSMDACGNRNKVRRHRAARGGLGDCKEEVAR